MSFEGSKAIIIKDLSGNVASQMGSIVRISGPIAVVTASGGSSLGSGAVVHGIRVKNLVSGEGSSISGNVWIGTAPFSGTGYPLGVGENIELKVSNFNQVRAVAAISGSFVSVIGIGA